MSEGECWAVVVAAGKGRRFGSEMNKVYQPLLGRPVLSWTLKALARYEALRGIVIVHAPDEEDAAREAARDVSLPVIYAPGGDERADSVRLGLRALPDSCDIALIHDAARPLPSPDLIRRCAQSARTFGSGIAARNVTDTIKRVDSAQIERETLDRTVLRAVQTPQAFRRNEIQEAYERLPADAAVTDDAQVYSLIGLEARLVADDSLNPKITTREDIRLVEALLSSKQELRVGMGYDSHRLVPGRRLILCGVEIPHNRGLDGHSDADAATHALIDALLGACAMGDIGTHFPDTDPQYKNANSIALLREIVRRIGISGYIPAQTDITIIAQKPKLAPYVDEMRAILARALILPFDRVSIKAKTNERMGFAGREEGIVAQAVVTVRGNGGTWETGGDESLRRPAFL